MLAADYLRRLADDLEDEDIGLIVITVESQDAQLFANMSGDDADEILREIANSSGITFH